MGMGMNHWLMGGNGIEKDILAHLYQINSWYLTPVADYCSTISRDGLATSTKIHFGDKAFVVVCPCV